MHEQRPEAGPCSSLTEGLDLHLASSSHGPAARVAAEDLEGRALALQGPPDDINLGGAIGAALYGTAAGAR